MITSYNLFVMGGASFYSPSFEREGEAAVFSVETLAKIGSPTLAVTIEHKNRDETAWAAAGAFASITTLTVATKDVSGIKEEVRIKFTLTGTDGDGFNAYMSAPAWRPY